LVLLSLLPVAEVQAATIDFNLPPGTLVTNQYPGVSFSSEPGFGMYVTGGFVCTGNPGINCQEDVYIDFATPVTIFSILAVEANEFGEVARFFFYNGATLLGSQALIGLGPAPGQFGNGNVLADLSAFTNVTRLEIKGPGGVGQLDHSYGGNGIGWDNLTYETADTAIPEPTTLALLGAGLIAAVRRRNFLK
jgi:hypothetical protein